jgi:hypothetical protein
MGRIRFSQSCRGTIGGRTIVFVVRGVVIVDGRLLYDVVVIGSSCFHVVVVDMSGRFIHGKDTRCHRGGKSAAFRIKVLNGIWRRRSVFARKNTIG